MRSMLQQKGTPIMLNNRMVSQDEWIAARTELLIKEKELTRLRDQLRVRRETNESGWPQKRRNRIANSLVATRRQEAILTA